MAINMGNDAACKEADRLQALRPPLICLLCTKETRKKNRGATVVFNDGHLEDYDGITVVSWGKYSVSLGKGGDDYKVHIKSDLVEKVIDY